MSISDKLRWRRLVNEIRFVNQEADLLQEVITEGGTAFHEHYLKYAAENDIDVQQLNRDHKDRVEQLYGDLRIPEPEVAPHLTGSLAFYDKSKHSETDKSNSYEMTKDEKELHECFNRLFKKLAMKIHPDKQNLDIPKETREEYSTMFREASSALEKRQYFILLDMAERLKIAQPKNYKQQNRWMKREIKELSAAIKQQKATYNYLFTECETEEQKNKLVKSFIAQVFGIKFS